MGDKHRHTRPPEQAIKKRRFETAVLLNRRFQIAAP
jgi:hypothetical protein